MQYEVAELMGAGFSLTEIKVARASPWDLHQAGCTLRDIYMLAYTPMDYRGAGFTCSMLATTCHFSPIMLNMAGFGEAEIRGAGVHVTDGSHLAKCAPALQVTAMRAHEYARDRRRLRRTKLLAAAVSAESSVNEAERERATRCEGQAVVHEET